MMMQELSKYAFANAKIRAMLSRLLNAETFSRLMDSKDIEEALEILKTTPYTQAIQEHNRKNDLKILDKMFCLNDLKIYRKVYATIPTKKEKEFVAILINRYEVEELKIILRSWHNKPEAADLDNYLLNEKISFNIDYKKIISAQNIEEIILLLDDTPYKKPLIAAKEKFKEKGSSFYLEAALDIDYYSRLSASISKLSSLDKKIASKILGIEIDIENINWLIRLRKYYSLGLSEILSCVIPGGSWIDKDTVRSAYATDGLAKIAESVSLGPYAKIKDLISENAYLIENFLYEILLREIKRALAGFPFTIGTVLGYLILKHRETRNVISLLYAKQYRMGKEVIAPLLRME
ncbi:MAG: V-type ATPase subunit [Candidatus Omnitrophica bacterium]|nr:V-type ATPase subunit [Candidatus Omnitrophota bacterium]